MKNEVVGGLYASLAMKHGIGKVRQKFPPKVSLTEPERRRVVDLARATARNRKPAERRSGVTPPSPKGKAPIARQRGAKELETASTGALGAGKMFDVPPPGVSGVRWTAPSSGQEPIIHPRAVMSPNGETPIARATVERLARHVAFDQHAPAELRLLAFSLLVGE